MSTIFFKRRTVIKNFINNQSLTILKVIKKNPLIYTKDLIRLLKKTEIDLSKSQVYRYITTLSDYELIFKKDWEETKSGRGYSYYLTDQGLQILNLFQNIFKKEKS